MDLRPSIDFGTALALLRRGEPLPCTTGSAARILFVLFSGLGDVIASTAIVGRLRQKFPQAHLTWLTDVKHAGVATACGAVDLVISSDGLIFESSPVLEFLRLAKFDRVIYPPVIACLADWERSNMHAVPFMLGLAGVSTAPGPDLKPALINLPAIESGIGAQWPELSGSRRTVVLVPTALTVEPWPFEQYQQLALALKSDGLTVVQLGAKGDALLDQVRDCRGMSLLESREIIRRSALYVGNDSGATWLALSTGTPIIAIMSPYKKLFYKSENRVVGFFGYSGGQLTIECSRSQSTIEVLKVARGALAGGPYPDSASEAPSPRPDRTVAWSLFVAAAKRGSARCGAWGVTEAIQSFGELATQLGRESLSFLIVGGPQGACATRIPGPFEAASLTLENIGKGREANICEHNPLEEAEFRWLYQTGLGPFEVIVVKGPHQAERLAKTLLAAVNWLKVGGVIILEDLLSDQRTCGAFRALREQFAGLELYEHWDGNGLGFAWLPAKRW